MAKKISVLKDYVDLACPTCKKRLRIDLADRGEIEHFYIGCPKCNDNFFAIKNKDLVSLWIMYAEVSAKKMEIEKE